MPNYVDNRKFNELLIKYKKTKSEKVFNEIGKYFLQIAINYLNKPYFIKYTQDRKDEMVSDAVFFMCKYIDRYDTKKNNPFAYFTTFARNAFLQYINARKKHEDKFKSIEYIEHVDKNEMSDMWGKNE